MPDRSTVLAQAAILALGLCLAGAGGALAAGGGGGGSSGKSCPTGQVWDSTKKTCVKVTGAIDDRTLYLEGRDRALAGEYEKALVLLKAVKNQNDSDVLTMIGYATRKLGRFDEGVDYYHRALALNPDNVNTHEYLGEAYAEKGQVDLAKAELAKVEALCGTECEQYEDLAKAIAGEPVD
ncbi:MAG: tetratricopeptide repeat protein [Rhodospirillaceae bacterium]|nr:tetratricopeptide repeat protein [Rhodospirillaceae bacterium]